MLISRRYIRLGIQPATASSTQQVQLLCPLRKRVLVSSGDKRNLGELSRFIDGTDGVSSSQQQQQQSLEDAGEWQARVSKDSFSNRGYYLDSSSIFASSVLLILLLSLSFQRILGLDKWFDKWLMSMSPKAREAEKARAEAETARKRLKSSWGQQDEEGNRGKDGSGT